MSAGSVNSTAAPLGGRRTRKAAKGLVRSALTQRRAQVGLALTLLIVGMAIFGPLLAPYPPGETIGAPYSAPSSTSLLGTDVLGRDVLSRVLYGGRTVLILAGLATSIALLLGVTIGLIAASSRGFVDDLLMRSTDVILAFPSILLALVAVATVGPKLWLTVLAVGIATTPQVARVVRGAAVEVVESDFVESAEALGESKLRVLFGEVLVNITSPLVVTASLRLTYSVGLIAGLSFLGFGVQPPTADWGLMINENRLGLNQQPLAVVVPVAAIAVLTVGTSLLGDGLARAAAGIRGGGGAK